MRLAAAAAHTSSRPTFYQRIIKTTAKAEHRKKHSATVMPTDKQHTVKQIHFIKK